VATGGVGALRLVRSGESNRGIGEEIRTVQERRQARQTKRMGREVGRKLECLSGDSWERDEATVTEPTVNRNLPR